MLFFKNYLTECVFDDDNCDLGDLTIWWSVGLFDFLDDIRRKNSLNPIFLLGNSTSEDLPIETNKKWNLYIFYFYFYSIDFNSMEMLFLWKK